MKNTLIGIIAVAICLTGTAQAATTHSVSIQNGGAIDPACGTPTSRDRDRQYSVSVNLDTAQSGCIAQIGAASLGGGLAVLGNARTFEGATSAVRVRANASQATTDLWLTPLFDEGTYDGPDIISLRANLFFDGFMSAGVSQVSPFVRSAAAYIRADATIRGRSGPTIFDGSRDTVSYETSVGATNQPGSDFESGFFGTSLLPTIQHDWRQPFSFSFSVTGNAGAFGSGDTVAEGLFDSINTFSFSKTGPAFIIPEGFTVNAPELNIVNNRWIDPRVTVSAVPLPAGLPLLLAGLGALGLMRRRQTKA